MGDDTVAWTFALERAARALFAHDIEVMSYGDHSFVPKAFEELDPHIRSEYYTKARIVLEA